MTKFKKYGILNIGNKKQGRIKMKDKMTLKEKVTVLEEKGFTWFKIADILSTTYDEVRYEAENEEGDK